MTLAGKIKSFWRPFQLVALATLPLLVLYCFRLVSSYSYDNDFGRDLVDIYAITQGDITLLGPKLSFGGLHTGPYYYYLFTPILLLFPGQPEALLYANAVLAWLALCLLGAVWIRLEKWPRGYSVLALYWIGISSYFIFSARGPGNAFSYVPWLVLLIGLYPQIWKRRLWWLWALYGLAWGMVVNFHLVVLFVLMPLFVALAGSAMIRKRRIFWPGAWLKMALFGGFILAFAPLVLFEVTHNFVMIRNTFIDKSYQAFTQNTNLSNPLLTSSNPAYNFWLFILQASDWVSPSLIIMIVVVLVAGVVSWKKYSPLTRVLAVSLMSALILVATIATSQLAFHYFFPFIILAQIVLIRLIPESKAGTWTIGILIVSSLLSFPTQWYGTATRPIAEFRTTVAQIETGPLWQQLQNNSFQVYVTREVSTAPIGHEYRYFLRAQGLDIDEPSLFSQSQLILWIAEQPLTDPAGVNSWELEQFGARELLGQQQIDTRTVLLFGHK